VSKKVRLFGALGIIVGSNGIKYIGDWLWNNYLFVPYVQRTVALDLIATAAMFGLFGAILYGIYGVKMLLTGKT